MKYILTPTEEGIKKGKKPLVCDSLKQAQFAMAINRGLYQLEIQEE